MRRKFIIYNVQCTIKLFLLLFTFYILHSTFYISTAKAVDSTPSADIASKLKAFQKEAASKAAQLKELINKKLQNKAFVGTLESQSGNSLTLAAKSGPKVISLNEDTLFDSNVKSKQKFSQNNLKSGDYIAALGDIDETGVLSARKIILLSPPSENKDFLWGQVISVENKLMTLRNKTFKNSAVKLPEDSKVKINDYVILTGSLDKNNIFNAGFLYVIPQSIVIKPKKIATPSSSN